jgi:hypothetical protein
MAHHSIGGGPIVPQPGAGAPGYIIEEMPFRAILASGNLCLYNTYFLNPTISRPFIIVGPL